ncbi:Ribonuclease H [Arachis hypogaea]|nr:Ribonuclease H [Arachis hypogaea]
MVGGRFCFYASKKGKHPGIYTTWEDCRREVDGFRDNQHKGFMKKSDDVVWLTTRDPLDANNDILKPDVDLGVTVVANKMSSLLLANSGEVVGEGSNSGSVGTLSSLVPSKIGNYLHPHDLMRLGYYCMMQINRVALEPLAIQMSMSTRISIGVSSCSLRTWSTC